MPVTATPPIQSPLQSSNTNGSIFGRQNSSSIFNTPNSGSIFNRTTTLPKTPTTSTTPTGVATSDLADQTTNAQKQGTDALQASVDAHTATKAAANPQMSIVDLLNSRGQSSDYTSRAKLAQQAGIQNYVGTAAQNQQLMGYVTNQQQTPVYGSDIKDANGNVIGQAKFDQNTGQPLAQPGQQNTGTGTDNTQTTNQTGQNNTQTATFPNTGSPGDQYNQDIADNLDEQTKALEDRQNQVDQIMNGTFPLSPAQQTILTTTKSQFDAIAQMQATANTSYQQAVALAGNRLGLNVQNQQEYLAEQNKAVNDGLQKINNLDAVASITIANLQQSFMDKDYAMINDNYNALQKTLESKQDAIASLQKRTDDLYTSTRDYNEKVKEFQQSQALEQAKFNLDLTENGYKYENGKIVIDTSSAGDGTATPGHTGNTLLDSNTKITTSGVHYVDGTNLTGKDATNMQHLAAYFGIPYLGKDTADAQANIETAKTNISNIADNLLSKLPKNGLGRIFDFSGNGNTAIGNNLKAYFQTDGDLASFNAYRSAAIQALRAMAGSKGLRINQAEIQTSIDNDIPKITDSVATAKAKIAKVQSMLNSQEKGIYGSKVYDTYSAPAATSDLQAYYNASPDHAAQIDSILQTYPGLTDAQLLQIANP